MINEDNYSYLCKLLKDCGFGDNMNKPLRAMMEKGLEEFKLEFLQRYSKDFTKSELQFSKSKSENYKDYYFFNKYVFQITNCPENKIKSAPQIVFIDRNNRLNNLDPYQLHRMMNRASILRELTSSNGSVYLDWQKMDFSKVNKYGNYEKFSFSDRLFNVTAQLDKLTIIDGGEVRSAIRELMDQNKKSDTIIRIEQGESTAVTYTDGDKDRKLLISADIPYGFKSYDLDNKKWLTPEENDRLFPPLYERKQKESEHLEKDNGQNLSGTNSSVDGLPGATKTASEKKVEVTNTVSEPSPTLAGSSKPSVSGDKGKSKGNDKTHAEKTGKGKGRRQRTGM